MSKKDFIALADAIREYNANCEVESKSRGMSDVPFYTKQLDVLADFCARQNPAFKRDRWLGYIAGTNGKNGGAK